MVETRGNQHRNHVTRLGDMYLLALEELGIRNEPEIFDGMPRKFVRLWGCMITDPAVFADIDPREAFRTIGHMSAHMSTAYIDRLTAEGFISPQNLNPAYYSLLKERICSYFYEAVGKDFSNSER